MQGMKNAIESINNILDQAEEKNLGSRNIQSEKSKEKKRRRRMKKTYVSQDAIKRNNLHIIEVTEGKEREEGTVRSLKEIIMTENFPNPNSWSS